MINIYAKAVGYLLTDIFYTLVPENILQVPDWHSNAIYCSYYDKLMNVIYNLKTMSQQCIFLFFIFLFFD